MSSSAILRLQFWGVRGSCPTPGPSTAEVGGNTSCVQLSAGDEHLILDGGTGLRALGNALLEEGPVRASILFSHVHWDHIQGVPFFAPIFRADTELDLYGAPEEGSLVSVLESQMTRPTFPVDLAAVPATLRFHDLTPGATFRVGSYRVRSAPLNHPNGVLAFRIEVGGRAIVYATDTEHYEGGRIDETLVELARGADILIYDAQYTEDEYSDADGRGRRGWGHSTWNEGVRVGRAAGVHQLILFHHDPSRDDAGVAELEGLAASVLPGTVAAR
ncbi:MAG TPA: MBL fold metallo-hydrolase, partial [Kofleriaceae bacterium]|nr:MBL fold metallo-hydrolase [Kofleriaceae bacterium]